MTDSKHGDLAELVAGVLRAQSRGAVTSAGPAIGCHGVALLRTGTLVAARDIDTAEGAEDASTLRALVDVCRENTATPPANRAKQTRTKQS